MKRTVLSRIFILTHVLIVLTIIGVQAQGNGAGRLAGARAEFGQRHPRRSPEVRATARTNWLTKMLTLTPDQAAQVKAINLDAATKHDAIFASPKGRERAQERHQINKDREQKIAAILTDAQKAKW